MIGAAFMIAAQAAPAFAPPLDRPIAYRIEEVREHGGETQRFAIDRRVTIRRLDGALVAAIETLAVDGRAGSAGPMFEAMHRAMLGRTVTLHLDAKGAVTSVDDIDAVWAAQVDGAIAAVATGTPDRIATATAAFAQLRQAPHAVRIARIGEMMTLLVAPPLPPIGPERAISLDATGPDGVRATLPGTERVVREDGGVLRSERSAAGTVGGVAMQVAIVRRVDPATGLLLESQDRRTSDAPSGPLAVTRTIRIMSPVK